MITWRKVQNFKNPIISKFKILKHALCLQSIIISSLNDQLPLDELKIHHRSYQNLPNSALLWKVSHKILNSGIILTIFTHVIILLVYLLVL